jgi:hypothetical protein
LEKQLKNFIFAISSSLLLISGISEAGAPVPTVSSASQNRGYAGLAWTLGAKNSGLRPDVVVGYQSVKVKSDNNVSNGMDINLRLSLADGISVDSTRLSYLAGSRDFLGNFGFGYSFKSQSVLGTLSAQSAFSRFGLDYELSNKAIVPFIEILSADRPKKVDASGY